MSHLPSLESFWRYESIRDRLPLSPLLPPATLLASKEELIEVSKGFFLDAFGVLNVGEKVIKEALEFVAMLRAKGKPLFVLTNSASIPKERLVAFFTALGYDFTPHEVISSREVLWHHLGEPAPSYGIIAPEIWTLERPLHGYGVWHEEFWESEAFLFLGSGVWSEALQERLKKALRQRARPIWVANPDITAPRGEGRYSLEPGFYTLLEEEALFEQMRFIGKPFPSIFEHALARAKEEWNLLASEIAMVGDTLHTDILGANAMGIKSVLLEGYGFFAQGGAQEAMEQSQIHPSYHLLHY